MEPPLPELSTLVRVGPVLAPREWPPLEDECGWPGPLPKPLAEGWEPGELPACG